MQKTLLLKTWSLYEAAMKDCIGAHYRNKILGKSMSYMQFALKFVLNTGRLHLLFQPSKSRILAQFYSK
jgi:hypothetical protein